MDEYTINPISEDADVGEQEVVDLQEDQNDEDSEDSVTGEGEGGEPAEDAARQEEERVRKFNASMAAARRCGEKAGEERATKAHNKRISEMRLPNPEKPGSYFESVEEMEAYAASYKRSQAEVRAKRENRSVDEILEEDANREFISRQRKAAEKKTEARDDKRDSLEAHVSEMRERYPDVDILKLEQNAAFRKFAGSRYGKESLADLYESYTELMGGATRAAAAKTESKAKRATGGSTGKSSGTLSTAQKAALQRWNENNPDMKMTEKEFLERG